MDELKKNIRMNKLYSVYGILLSKTQKKMIELYYEMDLSLSEIAEEEGITRNAVFDGLKKAEKALESYENDMHLLEKEETIRNLVNELKKDCSEKQLKLLEEIERRLD